jgi:PST family polysaccharide transporter
MGLTIPGADYITGFLGDRTAAPLLKVLALIIPIQAIGVVPRAVLEKELQFKRIAVRDFAGEIAFGLVGVSLALMDAGVWSLVGAAVSQRLVGTAALWMIISWRPGWQFSWTELRRTLNFGVSAALSGLLNKSLQNIDYFVIGRWLGAQALGYYTLAFQIAVIPQRRTAYIVTRVAFPALALKQKDLQALKKGFLEGVRNLWVVLTTIAVLIVTGAPLIISLLYSDKWLPAVLPMQILALVGFFYGAEINDALYYAVGKPQNRFLIIALRITVFLGGAITFGLKWGLGGVALSLLLAAVMTWILSFRISHQILNTSWADLGRIIWRPMTAVIMSGLLSAYYYQVDRSVRTDWLLAAAGVLIVGTFGFLLRDQIRSLLQILQQDP